MAQKVWKNLIWIHLLHPTWICVLSNSGWRTHILVNIVTAIYLALPGLGIVSCFLEFFESVVRDVGLWPFIWSVNSLFFPVLAALWRCSGHTFCKIGRFMHMHTSLCTTFLYHGDLLVLSWPHSVLLQCTVCFLTVGNRRTAYTQYAICRWAVI